VRTRTACRLMTAALVPALVVGVTTLGAGAAGASTTTRYVGASAGGDTGCASPGYTSVQAAVDAANPGDTVYLCGTTPYPGQVVVHKKLTLTGSKGASITAPGTWAASSAPLPPQFATDHLFVPQALVVAWGSGVSVTIKGLTIAGPLPGDGGCAEQEFGILVIGNARATITGDRVLNIRDANPALYGCQFGVGIMAGREYWPTSDFSSFLVEDFVGRATVTGTTVSGYQKGGIVSDGPGSSLSVSHSAVTGAGPYSALGTIIAQNGIQISRGATGSVTHTLVAGNQYSGPNAASSAGVLVFGGCGDPLSTHVSLTDSKLVSNDIGAYLFNADPACAQIPATRTHNTVSGNTISDSAVTNTSGYSTTPLCGYQAGISDFGNGDALTRNKISGTGYQLHPTCTLAEPYVTYPVQATGARRAVRKLR
jgi:hypothetical protein